MSDWNKMFAGAVTAYGGIRASARIFGVSPATVQRIAQGQEPDPKTARVIGPVLGACACCGQSWPEKETGHGQ